MLTLSLLLLIPVATSSVTATNADSEQAVRLSRNGEFIARNYPIRALKAREQGKVGFRLVVEPDGSLSSCEVTESSGSKSLDNETCELIALHARITPVRNIDGRAVRAVQNGYINWKLPESAPELASASATKGGAPEKIICKKSPTTGSLIKRTKTCLTGKQWAEQQRIAQERGERIIGVGHNEAGDSCNPGVGAGGC